MATTHRHQVIAIVGDKEIKSPAYESEEDAQRDLNAIRQAQKTGEFTDLPWLSVHGSNIVAAHISRKIRPRGPVIG